MIIFAIVDHHVEINPLRYIITERYDWHDHPNEYWFGTRSITVTEKIASHRFLPSNTMWVGAHPRCLISAKNQPSSTTSAPSSVRRRVHASTAAALIECEALRRCAATWRRRPSLRVAVTPRDLTNVTVTTRASHAPRARPGGALRLA